MHVETCLKIAHMPKLITYSVLLITCYLLCITCYLFIYLLLTIYYLLLIVYDLESPSDLFLSNFLLPLSPSRIPDV